MSSSAARVEVERPFELRVLDRSIALVADQASQKGLALSFEVLPGTPEVLVGDAVRVQQVLVNLLCNATKFTEKGSVFLSVRPLGAAREGERVELEASIRDTGMGIPKDRLNRLFMAFSQVDASTTRQFGGTGLGLAISKQLVELMGGRIRVESTRGGIRLLFHLLRARRQPVPARASRPSRCRPRSRGAPRGTPPLRILVAEDNRMNQRVLRLLLERHGYSADLVDDGRAAVEAALAQPYDLVLMDIQMPEMDGLEATRILRRALPEDARRWRERGLWRKGAGAGMEGWELGADSSTFPRSGGRPRGASSGNEGTSLSAQGMWGGGGGGRRGRKEQDDGRRVGRGCVRGRGDGGLMVLMER